MRTIVAAIAAALMPLVVNIRIILDVAHYPFDYDGYHLPLSSAVYRAFPAPAMWDAFTYGGTAMTSNPQTAQFHPPQLVVFAVSRITGAAELSPYAFEWVNLLNFVVLAVGAFAVALVISRSTGSGLLAAALVSVSGGVLSQSQHLGVIGSLAALPWAVCFLVGPISGRPVRRWAVRTIGLGLALAYSLSAGYFPQFAAVEAVCIAVVVMSILLSRAGWAARGLVLGGGTAIAVLLNLGTLAGFALAPDLTVSVNAAHPVDAARFLTLLSPDYSGILDGPASTLTTDPTRSFAWGGLFFVPLLTAALIARTPAVAKGLIGVALLAVVCAVAPIVSTVSTWGGLWRVVRSDNFVAPALIIAAIAAATGWSARRSLVGRRLWIYLGTNLVVIGAILVLESRDASSLNIGLPLIAAGLVVWLAFVVTLRRLPRALVVAVGVLILLEGAGVAGRAGFIQSAGASDRANATMPLGDPQLLALLRGRAGLTAANARILGGDWNGRWSMWQIPSASGFQPQLSVHWEQAASAASSWRDDRRFGFDRFAAGIPQQLAISTYVTRSSDAAGVIAQVPGATSIYEKYGVEVIAIPHAAPLVTLSGPAGSRALDLRRRGDGRLAITVPCTAPGAGRSITLVGAYDERWSAALDRRALGTGRQTGGENRWALPAGACGTMTVTFTDRSFVAGSVVAAATFLAIAAALPAMAIRSRRSRREAAAASLPLRL